MPHRGVGTSSHAATRLIVWGATNTYVIGGYARLAIGYAPVSATRLRRARYITHADVDAWMGYMDVDTRMRC